MHLHAFCFVPLIDWSSCSVKATIERYKKAHAVGSSSGPPLLEHNAQVLIQTHASYIYLTVSHSKIRWSFYLFGYCLELKIIPTICFIC
jgi:hypothetical protein